MIDITQSRVVLTAAAEIAIIFKIKKIIRSLLSYFFYSECCNSMFVTATLAFFYLYHGD